MITTLQSVACAVVLATMASAQQPTLYIDIQSSSFTTFGAPASSFPAAAPDAGMWTVLDTTPFFSTPAISPQLTDTSGAQSPVTITVDSPTMSLTGFDEDSALTMGDDQALLDDCGFFAGPGTFTFNNVPSGTYDLYTYALAPDVATYPVPPTTTVDVVGSSGPQSVSGDFAGGYALGATHAMHTVTVGALGTIVVNTDVPNFAAGEFDSINGFQLVPAGSGQIQSALFCIANNNSTGLPGICTATGFTSAALNDVTLRVSQIPPGQFGIFVVAPQAGGMATVNQGIVCLQGPTGRFNGPNQIWQADANGQASLAIDLTMIPTPTAFVGTNPGDVWYFQAWYRDVPPVPGTPGSNFTTGFEIIFD